jgi:hypothetical protein
VTVPGAVVIIAPFPSADSIELPTILYAVTFAWILYPH